MMTLLLLTIMTHILIIQLLRVLIEKDGEREKKITSLYIQIYGLLTLFLIFYGGILLLINAIN